MQMTLFRLQELRIMTNVPSFFVIDVKRFPCPTALENEVLNQR